mgnify:CR=1 FL=1
MSNKRTTRILVILLIVTNIITFGLTNVLTLQFNNKVILPKKEYEELYSTYKDFSKVLYIESIIKENYLRDADESRFLDGQLKGMVQTLEDPYSQYLTADEYAALTEQTSGIFGGIGVIVTPGDDNLITVVSPIEGTPGERAGIKPGDKIIKVNGTEYYAENMDAAVKVMKGKPNTKVTLTIMRRDKEGNNQTIDMDITREEIRLETVKSNIIDDNIGYIKLTSFDELTYDDFVKDLRNLEKSEVEGLIIDLRNNPGGLLNVCANIADEFLGEGDIVYTEDKSGNREYLKSKKSKTDLPLVVLVNGGSASASEILAGAIKDHNRGELIGTTTFGKGVVQRIRGLPDGSGIKLTISEYFTPNGTNIHGIGIEPDIIVELPDDIEEIGINNLKEDTQLQKAIEVVKSKTK